MTHQDNDARTLSHTNRSHHNLAANHANLVEGETGQHRRPGAATAANAGLPASIRRLDLERITWKLRAEDPSFWTEERLEQGEREYRRFLALKLLHPRRELVPTELVDKIWHQHILDTSAYTRDCERIFGRMLHHYPYYGMHGSEDAIDLSASFQKTAELYHEAFGEKLPTLAGARCDGKACHVDTECRCR